MPLHSAALISMGWPLGRLPRPAADDDFDAARRVDTLSAGRLEPHGPGSVSLWRFRGSRASDKMKRVASPCGRTWTKADVWKAQTISPS